MRRIAATQLLTSGVGMVRLTLLQDVLFPVEERPVYVQIGEGDNVKLSGVPQKKAIIRKDTGRVLGIVSNQYRLVSNQQALDWGRECCRVVFPETQESEWEVSAVDAPHSGSFCWIDLIHKLGPKHFNLTPEKNREVFAPFIRVTNSFNGMRRLSFEIGFIRAICGNGMIFPKAVIRHSFCHLRRAVGARITFDFSRTEIKRLEDNFRTMLRALRNCSIPRSFFEPLTLAVLAIREPKGDDRNGRRARDWGLLRVHISRLSDHYKSELGENAYAVFNTITDFASRPSNNRCVHRERHGFQKLAGKWLQDFCRDCCNPGFDIGVHIERLNEINSESAPMERSRFKPENN